MRERIVLFVNGGGSKAEAARRYNTCWKTVSRYCAAAAKGAGLAPKPWPGRKRRLDSDLLLRQVAQTPSATLAELGKALGISRNAVWKRLRLLAVTRKKTDALPRARRT
jgi:transposase